MKVRVPFHQGGPKDHVFSKGTVRAANSVSGVDGGRPPGKVWRRSVVVGTGGRVREGGGESHGMPEKQVPSAASSASAQTLESVTELRGHQVVQDRVDGGVGVLHDAGEVEEAVVAFHA